MKKLKWFVFISFLTVQFSFGQGLTQTQKDSLVSFVKDYAKKNPSLITLKINDANQQSFYVGYDGRTNKVVDQFNNSVDIGSGSKLFTAAAIFQLIEKNKIKLTSKLVDILPNPSYYKNLLMVKGKNHIKEVTVLNLLNHTSGLPDYFIENDDDKEIALHGDSSLRFSPKQLIELAKKTNHPTGVPGGPFKYCNTGYIFLGLIIEKVSGMKYHQFVQKNILNKLGLNQTFFGSVNPPKLRSAGHFKGKLATMPATMAWSAGEIISTLDDMDHFIKGWNEGKLFSKSLLQKIKTENFHVMGGPIKYGMGVIDILGNYGHAGQTFGFQTYTSTLVKGNSLALSIDDASVSSLLLAMMLMDFLGH